MSFDKVILIHNALIIPGNFDALKNKFIPLDKSNKHTLIYKFAVSTYSKSITIYQDNYSILNFSLEECITYHNIIKKICESKTEALLQIKNESESIAKIAEVKLKDFPDKNIFIMEVANASQPIDFKSLFENYDDFLGNVDIL